MELGHPFRCMEESPYLLAEGWRRKPLVEQLERERQKVRRSSTQRGELTMAVLIRVQARFDHTGEITRGANDYDGNANSLGGKEESSRRSLTGPSPSRSES
ncbi:hypothetical protein ACLOJK_040389 [Asimina triloba]